MRIGLAGGLLALMLALWLGRPTPAPGAAVRVAVAANFAGPMRALVSAFRREGGPPVAVSVGSTGKLYAQITHGAPFDLFFAADVDRPARLGREGRAVRGSRATYAVGRLAFWLPGEAGVADPAARLRAGAFSRLAIANPDLAPYGRAARQALRGLGAWRVARAKLVRGESVGQAYQFVAGGAADAGLVARAQLRPPVPGTVWAVPAALHDPIEQQVVLLREGPAARRFLEYALGPAGRAAVARAGYEVPAP